MSNTTLIIGASGTGKSSSLRNLNSKETFILSVLDKPLPFRGYKKLYRPITSWDDKEGNYYCSDDYQRIIKCIDVVNKTRPDIKVLIIDDWQYLLAHEFMNRVSEKGFDRFNDIALHGWKTIRALNDTRSDLFGFILAHSDTDVQGKSKCKTIGKLLDEKITLEGMFSCVLHTAVVDNEYKFLTRHDGIHLAKSPMGMFSEALIDNDLVYVIQQMQSYYEG